MYAFTNEVNSSKSASESENTSRTKGLNYWGFGQYELRSTINLYVSTSQGKFINGSQLVVKIESIVFASEG